MKSHKLIRLLMGIFSFAYNETKDLLISKRKDAYKQTNNSLHTNRVTYAINPHTFTTSLITLLQTSHLWISVNLLVFH